MAERDWSDAGQGWQGKETNLRLIGWSRQRRVVLLRRQFNRPLALFGRRAIRKGGRNRADSARARHGPASARTAND